MTSNYQRWKGIMKCYPFEEKRLAKWEPPYIIQPKYDGDRCRNAPLESSSVLLTSEENIFYSVPHINEQIEKKGLWKIPLDGELYNHDIFLEGGHELIHSIVSRTINIHSRHKEMEFHVFDVKYPEKHQMSRISYLNVLAESGLPKNIKVAPYWICNTLDEIKNVYNYLVNLKYEGIIVRHKFADYREKRSIYLMKFKPKKHDIYTIVGWNEETSMEGIPKGRIGSLIMSSQEGDTFSVGAGLDFEEKEKLWKVKETLVGKQAMVYYQHLTNKKIPKGTFDIKVI
jgi:ATP-dependent DNA ligase